MPAELPLVRLHSLRDEAVPSLGAAEGGSDRLGITGRERRLQLGVVPNLVLHPPEGFDGVPVPVGRRVLQPAEQRLVNRAARLLHHRSELERRRQLGEVQHPVDLPVAVVDVDCILEERRGLRQAHAVCGVEARFEVREVALHLGDEPVAPPVREMLAVDGEDRVEVLAHPLAKGAIARDAGRVAGAVLRPLDPDVGIRRDCRGVDVAVHVLGQPVDGERRAEPPEHVVAAEPPAPDVEEHGADRMGDVQVVVDPEEVPLDLRIPLNRKGFVAEELAEDLLCRCHGLVLQDRGRHRSPAAPAIAANRIIARSPWWQVIDDRSRRRETKPRRATYEVNGVVP